MLNIFSCPWYIYLCIKLQNDNLIVLDYFPGFQIGVKIFSESNSLEVIGIFRFFRVWTLNISFSGAQRLNAQHGSSLFYNLFTFVQTEMYILEKIHVMQNFRSFYNWCHRCNCTSISNAIMCQKCANTWTIRKLGNSTYFFQTSVILLFLKIETWFFLKNVPHAKDY